MIHGKHILTTLVLCFALPASARSQAVIHYSVDELTRVREALKSGDREAGRFADALLKRGKKALKAVPKSITTKEAIPPSGDKRDYMSQGRYWWADPSKPDGLPYIRRDGETNPEIERMPDHTLLNETIHQVQVLTLSYVLSGEAAYAKKAVEFLKVWFLDDSTRMNPNMNFAQGIPGRSAGRGVGIIDGRRFSSLTDVVTILASSPEMNSDETTKLRRWFSEYYDWLRNSKNGKDEEDARNNHGTWYDVQAASIALFLGKNEDARGILNRAKEKRIAAQIEPDGSQPEELARTVSWDYSLFNLEAHFLLASLGDRAGVDLWKYETSDGRSLRKALDWLLPVFRGERKWTHKQIRKISFERLCPLLMEAGERFGNGQYRADAERLSCMRGWSTAVPLNWKSLIHY